MSTPDSSIGGFVIGESPIEGAGSLIPSVVVPGAGEPSTLLNTIPAYLYQQYQDDDALQSFMASYNQFTQAFVDWFNALNLPAYTNDNITGLLLDWVGTGLYGFARPLFPSGRFNTIGPFNSWTYDTLGFNTSKRIGSEQIFATDDDIYKRCLTWNFYKGDGDLFNARWLKRRVMRFIAGDNGRDAPVDSAYRISVSFGDFPTILILNGRRRILDGTTFNQMDFNSKQYNEMDSVFIPITNPVFDVKVLLALALGLQAGILQIPFQLFRSAGQGFQVIIGSYNGTPGSLPIHGWVFGISGFGSGGF